MDVSDDHNSCGSYRTVLRRRRSRREEEEEGRRGLSREIAIRIGNKSVDRSDRDGGRSGLSSH